MRWASALCCFSSAFRLYLPWKSAYIFSGCRRFYLRESSCFLHVFVLRIIIGGGMNFLFPLGWMLRGCSCRMCCILCPAARISWETSPLPLQAVWWGWSQLPQQFVQLAGLQTEHCNFHADEWVLCGIRPLLQGWVQLWRSRFLFQAVQFDSSVSSVLGWPVQGWFCQGLGQLT